jgi:beta-glucosidase
VPAEPLAFPAGFLWGAATSAHQVEGGNTCNDWWRFEQLPGVIRGGRGSGDACRHLERFDSDFALAQADALQAADLDERHEAGDRSRLQGAPGRDCTHDENDRRDDHARRQIDEFTDIAGAPLGYGSSRDHPNADHH